MPAKLGPVFADDSTLARLEPLTAQELAVVVPGEEARFLALGPPRGSEPSALGLGARRLLVLLAEREADPCEAARVEGRKHVALILGCGHAARE